jgi:uncharacterized protein (DUF58 family)
VRRSASPKLFVYASFSAATFLVALILGRPEVVALGAPFAFYLVVALTLVEPPELSVAFVLASDRAIEGEELEGELRVTALTLAAEVDVRLALPRGIEFAETPARVLRLARGEQQTVPLRVSCRRWGAYRIGDTALRVRDRFGLLAFDEAVEGATALRVYPRLERLRLLVRPLETQPFAGNQVARSKGEGIQFADIRPFAPGDRVRRINWRVSARRQELYVNEAHPEQNSDLVLFLDTFAEARHDEEGTLDLAVRAAASVAREYLARGDRVGLVGFGGMVRWLEPGMGTAQFYRIVETLLETEISVSFAWRDIDVLPGRSLPPQALVVALSPLLDERAVGALLDLRARGFDLVVVDVSPLPFTRPPADETEALAARLWPLWREALRFRFERLGVAVVEWSDRRSLSEAIEEVTSFRRYARRVSV